MAIGPDLWGVLGLPAYLSSEAHDAGLLDGQDERMMIMRWFIGSRLSRIYLAVVAVVTVLAVWEILTWGEFPIVWVFAMLLAAPTSFLLEMFLPADWNWLWSLPGSVLVGALANIAALKGMRASVRRRRPPAAGVAGDSSKSQQPAGRSGG